MGLIVVAGSFGLLACGGGERQDVDEPEGDFPVSIVSAEFPAKQRLAETSELTLSVRNDGDETIPDLAITINTHRQEDAAQAEETTSTGDETTAEDDEPTSDEQVAPIADGSFSVLSEQSGLAIPSRPVWILEANYPKLAGEIAPAGAQAAQTNTYAFGELEPGETIDIVWRVTPVQGGDFTVDYRLAAGLQGKAVAVTDDGSVPEGEFVVRISTVPPQTRVTADGKVVPIKKSDIVGQAGTEAQKQELGN